MTSPNKKPASLSLDMDNLWCYQRSFGLAQWQQYPNFLPLVIPRIVDFLASRQLNITFFAIGQDASQAGNQPLYQSISAHHHEIANHSFHHQMDLHQASEAELEQEISAAQQAIFQASGQTPTGFRGPAFGQSPALLKTLFKLGFSYDASTLPNSVGALARWYHQKSMKTGTAKQDKQLYGSLEQAWQPLKPYYWQYQQQQLLEIPVTSMPLLRLPFHGTYLHYLADRSEKLALGYFKTALLLCRLRRIEPSFLLHCTDFIGYDDGIDLDYLPGMRRSCAQKMAFMHQVMGLFQQYFRPLSMRDYIAEMSAISAPGKEIKG
ncbi:polysaccharide deacetylase family protein [Neptunicella sp. SCSIO 80796]|uniref:polysaccharide deacetylase family protein n=1 Tax=Neptunicella plasticusilytica TaxID=3117012 RepID=UPI003A4D7F75